MTYATADAAFAAIAGLHDKVKLRNVRLVAINNKSHPCLTDSLFVFAV